MMAKLREGERINNYLLEARVGAGSFGEVWRAKHHVFDDVVAIKIPTDPQFVRNLQREGVAVHGLRHPNIVRIIDLDPYSDPPYLIMEYVAGPSLRAAIDHYQRKFPVPAAVAVMRGILSALSLAHENKLIHRDIKPANILLSHALERIATIAESAVKVADFGLGHVGGVTTQSIMQSGSMTTEEGRSIAGTLAYMSPEQKEGRAVDGRSDLFSCGIVLFEMLTGERPQGSDLPSSVRSDVPAHLDRVFQRCYTRSARRYETAREMLDALTPDGAAAPPLPPQWAVPSDKARCQACGTDIERGDQYCIGCGDQLVASPPRCSSCRAFVHASDRFCIFCGQDLRVLGQ